MLTVTIRDKDGDQRRLVFDKKEVGIGRSPGSDILLARNNISKRHARFVDKENQLFVFDLRSTNGTYVNGRRISAPEMLGEDDKVYIGDFILTASLGESDEDVTDGLEGVVEQTDLAVAEVEEPAVSDDGVDSLPDAPSEIPEASDAAIAPSESDEDDEADDVSLIGFEIEDEEVSDAPVEAIADEPAGLGADDLAHWLRLVTVELNAHFGDSKPEQSLSESTRGAVIEQAHAFFETAQKRGDLGDGVGLDELVGRALAEYLGLGPLEALLANADVQSIFVNGPESVFACSGADTFRVDHRFSSIEAYEAVVDRLASVIGADDGALSAAVEGTLHDSVRVKILRPPISAGASVLVFLRIDDHPFVLDASAEGIVREALVARENILITGPAGSGRSRALAAVAQLLDPVERVALLSSGGNSHLQLPHLVCLDALGVLTHSRDLLQLVGEMRVERVLVDPIVSGDLGEMTDLTLGGYEGWVATSTAPDVQALLTRLGVEVSMMTGGASREVTHDLLCSLVGLVVRVALDAEGRSHIIEIVRVSGSDTDGVETEVLFTSA